jgi:hypothetical protein
MRSFRLDAASVGRFLDAWPTWVVGAAVAGALVYLGREQTWGPIAGVLLCGVSGGYLLRGAASARRRDRYPNARSHVLLSVGMATLTLGVATRMAFPAVQGSAFDLAWLGVSFASILAFVVANRHDEDVVR